MVDGVDDYCDFATARRIDARVGSVSPIDSTVMVLPLKMGSIQKQLRTAGGDVALEPLQHQLVPDALAAFAMLCARPYEEGVSEGFLPDLGNVRAHAKTMWVFL